MSKPIKSFRVRDIFLYETLDPLHKLSYFPYRSKDNSVGIVAGWMADVQFRAEASFFPLIHSVNIGSEAQPASYPIGTGGDFPGGKTVMA
jgi:hypothetical protein